MACYYGGPPRAVCDIRRPGAPTSMERLLKVGAEPERHWPLRTRCCGGSCYCGGPLIGALPEATLKLSYRLLKDAKRRGADAIATVCPLCQFNLEAFHGDGPQVRRVPRPHGRFLHAIGGDRVVSMQPRRAPDAAVAAAGVRWAEGGAHVQA